MNDFLTFDEFLSTLHDRDSHEDPNTWSTDDLPAIHCTCLG